MAIITGADYALGSFLGYQDVNEIKNHCSSSTAPTAPTTGMLWYDSANQSLNVWNGSAWEAAANNTQITMDGSTVKIGGSSNYLQVTSDGTTTLVGTATAWDDLRIEPVARTTGSNAPTFEKWFDDAAGTSRGVYLYSFDDAAAGSEKEIHFIMQMPHNALAGGGIYIHVHWVPAVSDTTATPRWGLEYAWKEPGAVFGDSTIIYAVGNTESAANLTAGHHYITGFAALTPDSTQDGLSAILIGRLFRDSANAADTYNASGAKCGLLYVDAHYQIDSFGSSSEYTK